MSTQDDFTQVFVWILGLLVLFTIVVALIARSIGMDENSGPMSDKDIDQRTMPYGNVKVAETKTVTGTADGVTAPETVTATNPIPSS